jgi:anti-sigma regulatory factor (Ser/Thr protein kinase)/anti-anti-sigma regulatory factor
LTISTVKVDKQNPGSSDDDGDKTPRGEAIRHALVDLIDQGVPDAPKIVAAEFGISRQALNKHVSRLVRDGILRATGSTRARTYALAQQEVFEETFKLEGLNEDSVWSRHVRPMLADLAPNAINIWHYGVTEMINNAIDHSGGKKLRVLAVRSALWREVWISDDGIGIFRKIQEALNLDDERHAVVELTKGKLTTDPSHHSGEGIFFTSRMFDTFDVLSGGVHLSHHFGDGFDWVSERKTPASGTSVFLRMRDNTRRTAKEVFDQFSGGEDYGFIRTVVPVRLAQYGDDQLISRSQAKRLMTRVQKFETVVLDFSGVETVGQAFADEIFRVWASQHQGIGLLFTNASPEVSQMIARAKAAA